MSARAVAVTQLAPTMIARLAFLRILSGQRPVARFSILIGLMRALAPLQNRCIDISSFFAIMELMNKRGYLGELELMLLLAVIHLGDEAYGVPISRELEKHRGKNVSLGSVYAALERLEGKGLVVSSLGDPTPERGGKAKRFFRITKQGLRQVQDTRRVLTGLWQTIPDFKFQP